MKFDLKYNQLPLFTLLCGGLGVLLRIWLYATGLDDEGLLVTAHPAGILVLILTATVFLVAIEPVTMADAVFEVTSALGTVGLSTGITPTLGTVSKIVLMLLMYAGRVGGYTFVLIFATEKARPDVERPVEKVLVIG